MGNEVVQQGTGPQSERSFASMAFTVSPLPRHWSLRVRIVFLTCFWTPTPPTAFFGRCASGALRPVPSKGFSVVAMAANQSARRL
jgi:hypothetical protein